MKKFTLQLFNGLKCFPNKTLSLWGDLERGFLLTTLLLSSALFVNAQNDTMYIMESGSVVGVYKVSKIDSIIFYKPKSGNITDADGNVYTSVQIGAQVWMKENLKTTKYNDGTSITNITEGLAWENTTTGAYCWNKNQVSYKDPYGALYNWYAVNTGKLCPLGWHVPTDAEWNTLIKYIDPNADVNIEGSQSSTAGGKMKSTGTQYWTIPNQDATNESGFSGLPGALRYNNGSFEEVGKFGIWWSSSEYAGDYAWCQNLYYDSGDVLRYWKKKVYGHSVRCVKN